MTTHTGRAPSPLRGDTSLTELERRAADGRRRLDCSRAALHEQITRLRDAAEQVKRDSEPPPPEEEDLDERPTPLLRRRHAP